MIILVALQTKMGILSHTVHLSWLSWYFRAIITDGCLGLLLLIRIDHIINDKDGKNLIILKDDILMLEHLWIFFLVVEIDRFEALRTWDRIIQKLILAVTVWLSDWYLVHDAAHFLLGVSDLIEADVEDHSSLGELISLLANFEDFVVFVELVGWKEGF